MYLGSFGFVLGSFLPSAVRSSEFLVLSLKEVTRMRGELSLGSFCRIRFFMKPPISPITLINIKALKNTRTHELKNVDLLRRACFILAPSSFFDTDSR